MKKLLLVLIFVFTVVGLSAFEIFNLWMPSQPSKPNLLFVNICSLMRDHLSPYGGQVNTAPGIEEFSKKSFIFDNYIGHTSWMNFFMAYYPKLAMNPSLTEKFVGYRPWDELPRQPKLEDVYSLFKKAFRYLEVPEATALNFETQFSEARTHILDQDRTDFAKKTDFLKGRNDPYFFDILIKFVHLPYSGANREEIPYQQFMSKPSYELYKIYLQETLAGGALPSDKISLFAILFGDRKQIAKSSHEPIPVNADADSLGLMNNLGYLKAWQTSPHFKADLEMLSAAYDAKLFYLDQRLSPILKFYGDTSLQDHSVVILAGDHGSALMQHGELHNGNKPYDELIRIPLMIHFPSLKESVHFPQQLSEESLQKMVAEIMSGELTAENMSEMISRYDQSIVISRDCMNNFVSLRKDSQWKLIKNRGTGTTELYNLQSDPLEKVDVAESQPQKLAELEDLLIERDKEVKEISELDCPTGRRVIKPPSH